MNGLTLLELQVSLRIDKASITGEVDSENCLIVLQLSTDQATTLLAEMIFAHV